MKRKYDNSKRAMRKFLRSLKDTQKILRKLEKRADRLSKEKRRPGRARSVRRAEAREAVLPISRVCPVCGKVFIKSKQWVVRDNVATCIACDRFCRSTKDVAHGKAN